MDSFSGKTTYNGRIVDTPVVSNQYTSLTIDPEFDLDLSGTGSKKPRLTGTIHTFQKRQNNVYGHIQHTVKPMLSIRNARRTLVLIVLNVLVLLLLSSWCSSSNSAALRAFSYLAVFDLLMLVTYMISIWLSTKQTDDVVHLFSYERIDILMVFASVVLSSLGAIFILKESFLRVIEQPDIAIGRLIPGALLGFFFHILVAFSIRNKPFQCVTEASSSSIIQEHVSDLSQPLCSMIPILNRILQPRVDPFFLLSTVGASLILLTDLLIQIDLYYSADTVASVLLALCTINTMLPLATCSARVLLNTTPPYVLGQLDKLLSEAQTLDGVLEIRNERFHTVALCNKSNSDLRSRNGFGLTLAGSINVRVRRDADEQMVLAHVTNRLSPLVAQLTVQVVKDDWNSGAVTAVGMPSGVKSLMGSSIIYGFNKPAAAVAPYQQTPPRKVPTLQSDSDLNKSDLGKVPSKKPPGDDFSFSVTSATNQVKPASYSSAGSNIAKMYKAAGFTSPPTTKRSFTGANSTTFLTK